MDSEKVSPGRNIEKSLARIESFSDAIFGFAITLLVLDLLQIPRPEIGENLFQSFRNHWQSFFAFLVGFCTILICWINHHHLFRYLMRYDARFIWINGILLLIVTFTPFPTSLFSEFLLKENSIGLILFGLTYFLIACIADLIWTYSHKFHLLDENEDEAYYRSIRMIFHLGVLYTLISFIICFISINVAMGMYMILFSVFAFPHYFTLRLRRYLNRLPRAGRKP
ncbi:MAG TPA: TMEM175 family protein [Cyclobacteriaceae bacterium]|nr:TMEM175 family protein [Cyclobacteriaceae bacterium]